MPNPFDQFDTQQANPFDQFDHVNQIPGLENSVDSSSMVGKDDTSTLDKVRGIAEAGISSATGLAALPVAAAGGLLFGGKNTDQKANEISEALTYQPRTDKGQEYTKDVGEFANYYLNPLMGGLGSLHFTPERLQELKKSDPTLAKVIEHDLSKEPVKNPFDQFDVQQDIANLHDKDIQQNLVELDRQQNLKDNLKDVVNEDAQSTIDARQAQLELDTKRQATLDYNAAERARQENAALPEDRSVPPDTAADTVQNHNLLLDELEKDAPKSGTPAFFKEPDANFPSPSFNARTRRQGGAINPEVFKEGFEKLRQLADGTWLRAHSDGQALTIDAHKDGHIIGSTTFDAKYKDPLNSPEKNAEAFMTSSKQPGMATQMYKFASELGNDISKSSTLTQDGKAMWDRFEQKGIAENGTIRSPGNKQMGALRIGERKQKVLEKVVGKKDMIPDDPPTSDVLEQARGEKDNSQFNYTESGATLAAMKRNSTAVLAASRYIQNAVKRADLSIRQMVFPVEKAFRDLSKPELQTVADVLKQEVFNKKRFSQEAIEQMSVKQQAAYAHIRAMFDDSLKIQNEARALKNQKPITESEAYLSSRWEGDFRRPIYQAVLDEAGNPKFDEKGMPQRKLVWYLAAHTQRGLEKQSAALRSKHPDLSFDPKDDHVVRYYKRQTDLQSAMSTMIDILGRDDPAVARIAEVVKDQSVNEAATFLGQEKHFKEKAGIRGFVGDRPGKEGFGESLAMIQQQIQYAKNAYKWSEMQKSGQFIKDIISDPQLKEEQPNNIKYIREYFKNAIGHGEATAIAHLEDAIRNLGISPTILAKGLGGTKTFFILQKLGLNAGYGLANLVQWTNTIPHLLSSEYAGSRANILTAIPVGISGGIAMALGHYAKFFKDFKDVPQDTQGFYKRAFKYAEDNGITARSIYDESPIESSFTNTGRAVNALGRTISTPETFTRSMSYMMAVQFLRDSGKFTKDIDLFQKAEEITNASMVDYRSSERPMGFSKMGMAGDFLNTLQTYPMNWYNQWNLFGREAAKGNIAPFVAAFAVQYAMAGAMGIPGFTDANKLYELIKDKLVSNKMYAKMQDSEFFSSPKMWMVNHLGAPSVYGWLSDKTNLGLTSRLNVPGLSDMVQAPGGPALDIAKQAYYAGKAVVNPNKDNIAQSLMASSPPGLQGLVENAPAFQGSTFEKRQLPDGTQQTLAMRPGDIGSHQAVYARTPEEDTIRMFGLRSNKEQIGREVGYLYGKATSTAAERSRTIPDEFYAALKMGNKQEASELYDAYVKLTGKGISDAQLQQQIEQNYMTSVERSYKAAKSVAAFQNIARMRSILQQIQEEKSK